MMKLLIIMIKFLNNLKGSPVSFDSEIACYSSKDQNPDACHIGRVQTYYRINLRKIHNCMKLIDIFNCKFAQDSNVFDVENNSYLKREGTVIANII